MKKLITLLLFTTVMTAQQTTIHFYASTEKTLGAELLTQTGSIWLGGGFSGALNPDRTANHEKWASIYAIGSAGYLGKVMVKYKAGLATFTNAKITNVDYAPMVGISGMYAITPDIAVEAGFDTFNNFTVGFTVLF